MGFRAEYKDSLISLIQRQFDIFNTLLLYFIITFQKKGPFIMESSTPNCVFSNNFIAFGSDSDFTIKFRYSVPTIDSENKVGVFIANETNITVTPILFKRMIIAMQDQLQRFEKSYGEIKADTKPIQFYPKPIEQKNNVG